VTWADHATAELSRTGHRTGGARAQVVSLLAGQRCCLSAQEIHDRLERNVGLASVYRALETLTSLHLVHRIDRDGVAHYEPADPSGEHHHHALCDRCGRLDAFEDAALESRLEAVLRELGYAGHGHDVLLRGTCPDCARL
jgi:Fur family ferric uptake transcriptional regulator